MYKKARKSAALAQLEDAHFDCGRRGSASRGSCTCCAGQAARPASLRAWCPSGRQPPSPYTAQWQTRSYRAIVCVRGLFDQRARTHHEINRRRSPDELRKPNLSEYHGDHPRSWPDATARYRKSASIQQHTLSLHHQRDEPAPPQSRANQAQAVTLSDCKTTAPA